MTSGEFWLVSPRPLRPSPASRTRAAQPAHSRHATPRHAHGRSRLPRSAPGAQVLEQELRYIRKSRAAAGGLQLIWCGDFHQLPPVTRRPHGGDHVDAQAFTNWGW
jgi:hypothetical protein